MQPENNLQLTGLISFGGRSHPVYYQMWFTEHHPDMCSIGPTERWLEHAARRFSHDVANESDLYTGISGNFYSTTRRAVLVQVEEALLESKLDSESSNVLFKIIAKLVHHAQDTQSRCTLIIDLNRNQVSIAGQKQDTPLDLNQPLHYRLAQSLSQLDGALHIGWDLNL